MVDIHNHLLYGIDETSLNEDSLISFPIASYTSGLFQLDHASNGNEMNLSVFFNSNNVAAFTDTDITASMKIRLI